MTTVHIALGDTNPTAAHVVFQRFSGAVLFGDRIRAYLVNGEANVELESTLNRAFRWRAQEISHGDVVTRTVAVPADGPVEYDDLVDVDPETMQPDDEPEAAWWQVLEEVTTGALPDGSVTEVKLSTQVVAKLNLVGQPGPQGLSTYDVAVVEGFAGTRAQWLASLVGPAGTPGTPGTPGDPGPSAYQVAVAGGFAGTQAQWLASLVGQRGPQGDKGDPGERGLSAYEVAVALGFAGTESEWLVSLVGPQGEPGGGIDGALLLPGSAAEQVAAWAAVAGWLRINTPWSSNDSNPDMFRIYNGVDGTVKVFALNGNGELRTTPSSRSRVGYRGFEHPEGSQGVFWSVSTNPPQAGDRVVLLGVYGTSHATKPGWVEVEDVLNAGALAIGGTVLPYDLTWSNMTLPSPYVAGTVAPGIRREFARVFLRGEIAWTGVITPGNTLLATITNTAHRPSAAKTFSVRTSPNSNVATRLYVSPSGEVRNESTFGGSASTASVSLDGLSYDL